MLRQQKQPFMRRAAQVKLGSNPPFAALLRNGYFGAKPKLCKLRFLRIAVIGSRRSERPLPTNPSPLPCLKDKPQQVQQDLCGEDACAV